MKTSAFAKRPRSGLTLLELILSLGLSTVVLAIIGMALSMYWRMFDHRRTTLEESRIARSVLRKVSDDLRSTIQFQPPDLSGLNIVSASMQGQLGNAAASLGGLSGGAAGAQGAGNPLSALQGAAGNATGNQTGANANGQNPTGQQPTQANATGGNSPNANGAAANSNNQSGNRGTGGGANQATGQARSGGGMTAQGGSTGSSGQGDTGEATGMADSGQTNSQLGLRGTLYELQIDISRLPRIDEYTALTDPNSPLQVVDIPSDVKTISYFVVTSDQEASDVSLKVGEETQPLRGLFRRERSRALSSIGTPLTTDGVARDNSQLLAEEVTAIEFSYFDGIDWYSDWDSKSMGGLPKAIEIAIEVNMTRPEATSSLDGFSLSSMTSDTTEAEPKVYKLVVSLPNDPPLELPTSEAVGEEGGANSGMGMDPSAGMNGQNAAGMQMGAGGMGMGGAAGQAGGFGGGFGGGGAPGGQPGQGGQGGRGGRGGNGRNGGGNGGPDNGDGQAGLGGGRQGGRGGQGFGGGGGQNGGGLGRGGGGQGFGGGLGGGGLGGGRGGGGLGGGLGGGGRGGGGLGGGGFGGGGGGGRSGGGLGGGGLGGGQGMGGGMGGRR